ncbi:hypothetical protein KSP39_PZI012913 [Platanthera zijinensis]|uniref:Uncharacterized protein n=1 Tax=Platanthera zijinensis TaxID=2320716 RepID=A0AAP0BBH2_9ASPA
MRRGRASHRATGSRVCVSAGATAATCAGRRALCLADAGDCAAAASAPSIANPFSKEEHFVRGFQKYYIRPCFDLSFLVHGLLWISEIIRLPFPLHTCPVLLCWF